jgi:hypothetical protein
MWIITITKVPTGDTSSIPFFYHPSRDVEQGYKCDFERNYTDKSDAEYVAERIREAGGSAVLRPDEFEESTPQPKVKPGIDIDLIPPHLRKYAYE